MDRKRATLVILISFLYGYSCFFLSFVVSPPYTYPVYIHLTSMRIGTDGDIPLELL
jgi:hypothetical protein